MSVCLSLNEVAKDARFCGTEILRKCVLESQKDWHEISAGAAEREIFTFLKERDVLHFRGKPLLNGLFRVEKKNKSLDSGEPVLRMIINAIPANALQETIETDIRTLPYFARWKTKPDGSATAGLDFRIFVQQEL